MLPWAAYTQAFLVWELLQRGTLWFDGGGGVNGKPLEVQSSHTFSVIPRNTCVTQEDESQNVHEAHSHAARDLPHHNGFFVCLDFGDCND